EGRNGQRGQPAYPALQDAIDDVFNSRIGDVSGRGKLAADMREIWMMQPRFDKRSGATPYSLVEQARFRAAFDFMRLRADVGEISEAIGEWWQEFSTADDLRRQDLMDQVRDEQKTRQRVRVREPLPKDSASLNAPREPQDVRGIGGDQDDRGDRSEDDGPSGDSAPDGEGAGAPRKRRRRRKPRTGGGGGSEGGEGGVEGGGSATEA
ncbi:MAG: poly(A) polymerase, partial [Variovorax sp.]|nr:poly(A) polymerase [Variovorax sp.]